MRVRVVERSGVNARFSLKANWKTICVNKMNWNVWYFLKPNPIFTSQSDSIPSMTFYHSALKCIWKMAEKSWYEEVLNKWHYVLGSNVSHFLQILYFRSNKENQMYCKMVLMQSVRSKIMAPVQSRLTHIHSKSKCARWISPHFKVLHLNYNLKPATVYNYRMYNAYL